MPTINNCNSSTTQTSGTRRYLSFTRSSGKFIYCNYPEKLTSVAVLGDYDKPANENQAQKEIIF